MKNRVQRIKCTLVHVRLPSVLNVGGVLVVLGDHPVEDVHDLFEVRDLGGQSIHEARHDSLMERSTHFNSF